MQHPVRLLKNEDFPRHGWLYALLIIILMMMVPLLLCLLLWQLPAATAADNGSVEGSHGVLQVRGELTEGACRLDMASAYQAVWLGPTVTARLAEVGSQGTPVNVRLQLKDCLRSPAANRDRRTGNLLWNAEQPAVSVSFIAPADADNPQLVKVHGTRGLALRIADQRGRDIRLGSRGIPLALVAGQNTLVYTVTPERTRAPLRAGAYSALVDLWLNYD